MIFFININDYIANPHKDKKTTKNIKFRNINITNKTNKKLFTKYNNESYLTLNNTTNKNDVFPKISVNKAPENNSNNNSNSNIFINEYKF